jgi:hypothetical protein
MKRKMKVLKPIDHDVAFKYKCPKNDCNYTHWLFLREVQEKGFKVVCDCGTAFKPKNIENIKILYRKQRSDKKRKNTVPVDLMASCVRILVGYGCSKGESEKLINEAYAKIDDKSSVNILKQALKLLEIENV